MDARKAGVAAIAAALLAAGIGGTATAKRVRPLIGQAPGGAPGGGNGGVGHEGGGPATPGGGTGGDHIGGGFGGEGGQPGGGDGQAGAPSDRAIKADVVPVAWD